MGETRCHGYLIIGVFDPDGDVREGFPEKSELLSEDRAESHSIMRKRKQHMQTSRAGENMEMKRGQRGWKIEQ